MEGFTDMKIDSFIKGHIHALEYYGGVPVYAIPDNTKCAVIRNYEKEVTLNHVYEEMEAHYGYVVRPARILSPTDKHEVENVCGWFERQILMGLKEKRYFSLDELNSDILKMLKELSMMKFQKKEGTRLSWFEEYDRPLLNPLPVKPFEVYHYDCAKVPDNYHVCIKEDKQHYYSVPYTLLGQTVIIKYSFTTILIEDASGNKVASHERSYSKTIRYITDDSHMPVNHYIGYNAKVRDSSWYLEQASYIGKNAEALIKEIISSKKHPEQAYRSCMGIVAFHISHAYTDLQIDNACHEALELHQYNYGFVKRILTGSENKDEPHSNIRGARQFE